MKEQFLGMIREQLRQDALKEVAEGKLKSPADLDEICGRLIPRLRKNFVTGPSLKLFKVTDDDLRQLFEGVLADVGIEVAGG